MIIHSIKGKIAPAKFRPSVLVLIAANMVPLYGAIFLGWRVFPIIMLFWVENVITGVVNIIKMMLVKSDQPHLRGAKIATILFFCVHYGMFTLVHGIFVFVVFGGYITPVAPLTEESSILARIAGLNLWWGILTLALSHIYSLFANYIGQGEYRTTSLSTLMTQPYERVVILHLVIIFGGMLIAFLNSPVWGVALLIVLKVVFDVRAHLKQHAGGPLSQGTEPL